MVKVAHQLLPVALWLFPASCTSPYLLVCPVVRIDGLLCDLNSPFTESCGFSVCSSFFFLEEWEWWLLCSLHTEAKTESPHLVAFVSFVLWCHNGAGGLGALRFSGWWGHSEGPGQLITLFPSLFLLALSGQTRQSQSVVWLVLCLSFGEWVAVNQVGLRVLCSGWAVPSGPQFFHLCSGERVEALLAQHALVRMTPASVDASSERREWFCNDCVF